MRALLVLALAATPSWAIGICENTPRQYGSPTLVDGDTFAVPGTQAWCENGKRGKRAFVELRDPNGKAEEVTATELKKRGFKPLVRGKCTLRARWGDDELDAGWPARTLEVEVVVGKTVVARHEVGPVPKQRRGDIKLAVHHAQPNVFLYIRKPICNGPPPGRFGPKDKGSCYADDEPVIVKLEVADCF